MGCYLITASAPDGTFTNKSSTYASPLLSEHCFLRLLPVHDVCLILLSDEQVVPDLDDVRRRHMWSSHICILPSVLAYKPCRTCDDMTCCPLFMICSPPGPMKSFPVSDLSVSFVEISGNMLFRPERWFSSMSTVLLLRFRWAQWFSPPHVCSSSSSSPKKWNVDLWSSRSLHLMILFLRVNTNSPSSSGVSNLSSSSAFSPSASLSHDEPWSSSSSMLLVHCSFSICIGCGASLQVSSWKCPFYVVYMVIRNCSFLVASVLSAMYSFILFSNSRGTRLIISASFQGQYSRHRPVATALPHWRSTQFHFHTGVSTSCKFFPIFMEMTLCCSSLREALSAKSSFSPTSISERLSSSQPTLTRGHASAYKWHSPLSPRCVDHVQVPERPTRLQLPSKTTCGTTSSSTDLPFQPTSQWTAFLELPSTVILMDLGTLCFLFLGDVFGVI